MNDNFVYAKDALVLVLLAISLIYFMAWVGNDYQIVWHPQLCVMCAK